MTNLAISTVCNLSCPYCFTGDHLGETNGTEHYVNLEAFSQQLDYLERSGIDEVRLLGGEPTLHPQFPKLVAMARERKLKIRLFSNGVMKEQSLACLEILPDDQCFVMMNVNAPAINPPQVIKRQKETLKRLGQKASLGFNIFRPDYDFDFLLNLIEETDCQRWIRLGMAQPCLSGDNSFIHPHQYRYIAEKIIAFVEKAAAMNIRIQFDCGFVRCVFSDEEIALLEQCEAAFGWHCNPILDIDIHQNVIHCYPLSNWGVLPLTEETQAKDLRETFIEQTQSYRQAGVFPECATCILKQQEKCSGGCLAVTMRRFRHSSFQLELQEKT